MHRALKVIIKFMSKPKKCWQNFEKWRQNTEDMKERKVAEENETLYSGWVSNDLTKWG